MLQRIIKCPPDKSLSHRALWFALNAKGTCVIQNLSLGLDVAATRSIVEKFAYVQEQHRTIAVDPLEKMLSVDVAISIREEWKDFFLEGSSYTSDDKIFEFDCRNSGTTARLAIGMFAAKDGFTFIIDGDESLKKRPMKRLLEALKIFGMQSKDVEFLSPAPGRDLPLKIIGRPFKGGEVVLKTSSAQLKSACLLAALSIKDLDQNPIHIELPIGSRDHTEIMLQSLGVPLKTYERDGLEIIKLDSSAEAWPSFVARIPKDPSAAAFWALYAYLNQEIVILPEVALNPTRTGWVKALTKLGFEFEKKKNVLDAFYFNELVGDLVIYPPASMNHSMHISFQEVPSLIDEIPLLACIACFNEQEALFEGVDELLFKESNRLLAVQDLISLLGRECEVFKNEAQKTCLKIFAKSIPISRLKSSKDFIDARKDHRIAMISHMLKQAFIPDLEILNAGEDVIAVSDPGFLWQLHQSQHDKHS